MTASQTSKLGAHYGAGFSYDEQRELRNAYREKRKELLASARSPDAVLRNDPALEALRPLELLKFAGFFALAHPQVIANAKDRKTYIVRPKNIQVSVLDQLMRTFRSTLWSNSPAKIDVLAVLQFTRALVMHDRNALQQEGGVRAPYLCPRRSRTLR